MHEYLRESAFASLGSRFGRGHHLDCEVDAMERESKEAKRRRTEIVAAARELFETKGIGHTTVKDIAEAVNVTRSLFYHYFPDKDAVVEAVLDDYVEDFRVMVQTWDAGRAPHDVKGSLRDCIKILRIAVFDNDSFRTELVTHENAGLYLKFLHRSTDVLAERFTQTTAVDYEREHGLPIDHVYETFYVLIIGLVGYMRAHPEADNELLEDLVAQALRLDMA